MNIEGARGLLVNVTGGPDFSLFEYNEVMDIISSRVDKQANVISGQDTDDSMGDEVRVTVIATGFGGAMERSMKQNKTAVKEEIEEVLPYDVWLGLSGGRGLAASTPPALTVPAAESIAAMDDTDLLIPTVMREKRFGGGR